MDRRHFLKLAGSTVGVGAALAAGLPHSLTAAAGPSPSASRRRPSSVSRPMKIGFIALTDATSVIMAHELGYFAERGIEAEIIKQASWPATRDALQTGELDAAHCLYSMPFSVATGIGGNGATDLKIAMILNNNGQAITLAKEFADVGYGDLTKAKDLLASSDAPELAMTFPGGTHDLWLRYWLAACGVDAATLRIGPVPPAQMIQNMTVGNVKGFCVGEPWGAVAVAQDIGFTTIATQDLWLHHPEKALVVNERFSTEQADTLRDAMGAILQASAWLDDIPNRAEAAETVQAEHYVNAPAADIVSRLTGVYDLGSGLGERDFAGEQMMFFRDGATNFPRKAHGVWALAQYQRLGLLADEPDYTALADSLVLTDLYAEVAAAEGIDVPDDDMQPFDVRLDGVTFDPNDPAAEATRPIAS